MGGITFEWHPGKAAANLSKHRISFEEAITVFADPLARIHVDPDHSEGDDRKIIVGHSNQGKLLLVAFTERQARIRLISARRATRQERKDYEESQKS